MGTPANLEGKKFGRLTVIEKYGKSDSGKVLWKCLCDCGNESVVPAGHLTSGNTKSCGCLNLESVTKHGKTYTRIWNIWQGMKNRCHYKCSTEYENYGGRGIKICEEWDKSFEEFYNWSMVNGYTDELSIDRIDVNGNYCPDNCRWSTWKEQCNNRRNNVYLTYNGKTKTASDWAKELGINRVTIYARLRYGWPIEKALTTPVKKRNSRSAIDQTKET